MDHVVMVLEYWHKNDVMGIRKKTDSSFACVLLIFILNQPQNSHIWAIWFKWVYSKKMFSTDIPGIFLSYTLSTEDLKHLPGSRIDYTYFYK